MGGGGGGRAREIDIQAYGKQKVYARARYIHTGIRQTESMCARDRHTGIRQTEMCHLFLLAYHKDVISVRVEPNIIHQSFCFFPVQIHAHPLTVHMPSCSAPRSR